MRRGRKFWIVETEEIDGTSIKRALHLTEEDAKAKAIELIVELPEVLAATIYELKAGKGTEVDANEDS